MQVPVVQVTGRTAVPDQQTLRAPLALRSLQAAPGAGSQPQLRTEFSQRNSPGGSNEVLDGGWSLGGRAQSEVVLDAGVRAALQQERNKLVSVAEHSRVQRGPAQSSKCGIWFITHLNYDLNIYLERTFTSAPASMRHLAILRVTEVGLRQQ